MSSSGCARRCRRTSWPRSTASPRTAPSAVSLAMMSISTSMPSAKSIFASVPSAWRRWSRKPVPAWSCWSVCSRTSSRARSTSPSRCAHAASKFASAASTSPVCCPCLTESIPISTVPAPWACRCLRARRKVGSIWCCATPPKARSSRSTITWTTCQASRARRSRCCGSSARSAPSPAPPASTPAAVVLISARSAPSSTCRGASRAAARRTTSKRSCG